MEACQNNVAQEHGDLRVVLVTAEEDIDHAARNVSLDILLFKLATLVHW